jgi:hypothetical protein
LLGGPRSGSASVAGDNGRIGGVAKRGGLLPNDSFRAEESVDSPGPGSDACDSSRPGSGVWAMDTSSDVNWAGVGIWRTAGEAVGSEGNGEPRLAGELSSDRRDGDGMALGCDDEG